MENWIKENSERLRIKPDHSAWSRIENRLERAERGRGRIRKMAVIWAAAAVFTLLVALAFLLITPVQDTGSLAANAPSPRPDALTDLELDRYPQAYYDQMAEWRTQAIHLQNRDIFRFEGASPEKDLRTDSASGM